MGKIRWRHWQSQREVALLHAALSAQPSYRLAEADHWPALFEKSESPVMFFPAQDRVAYPLVRPRELRHLRQAP